MTPSPYVADAAAHERRQTRADGSGRPVGARLRGGRAVIEAHLAALDDLAEQSGVIRR